MEKYVIIALILLFGVVYYFDKQSDDKLAALEQSSTLETEQSKFKQNSLLKTVFNQMAKPKAKQKNKKYQYTKHNNTDKSECGFIKTIDQMVITQFEGYIFEYPCTSGSKGSYITYFDVSGKKYKKFTLYLGLQLGGDKKSIWSQGIHENYKDKQSFLIILESDGTIKTSPLISNLHKYTKAKTDELAGLEIYFKKSNTHNVVALLKNIKDISGNPPSVRCYLDLGDKIEDVFSTLYNLKYPYASCSARWMLTEDISVTIHSFKAKYAYKFKQLYEMINKGLQKIIIERPINETYTEIQLKSTEK